MDKQEIQKKERQLNEKLKEKGLVRKEIPKDGACLFRAAAEQIFGTQEYHHVVRQHVVKALIDNKDRFEFFVENMPYDHYVFEMQKTDTWGGEIELHAISLAFSVNLIVYAADMDINVDASDQSPIISLCFSNGNHYDCVYTKENTDVQNIAQSIIYSLIDRATQPDIATEIDTDRSYRNIGIHIWKTTLRERQKQDLSYAKGVHQLSGTYQKKKNTSGEFQPVKGKRTNKTQRGRNKVTVEFQPRSLNSSSNSIGEEDFSPADYDFPEIIDSEEDFPSTIKANTSANNSESTAANPWGVKKDWGSILKSSTKSGVNVTTTASENSSDAENSSNGIVSENHTTHFDENDFSALNEFDWPEQQSVLNASLFSFGTLSIEQVGHFVTIINPNVRINIAPVPQEEIESIQEIQEELVTYPSSQEVEQFPIYPPSEPHHPQYTQFQSYMSPPPQMHIPPGFYASSTNFVSYPPYPYPPNFQPHPPPGYIPGYPGYNVPYYRE